MQSIRIVQVGLGPIGQRTVRYIQERTNMAVVAAVDPANDKCGKDLAEICDLPATTGVTIRPSLTEALADSQADLAVLTTTSDLAAATAQAIEIVSAGLPIVSSCEEMSYSWGVDPERTASLDDAAKANNVAVLGTGVNPGFLMDLRPIVMTGVCREVQTVTIRRIQDASIRRIPFQQKIGAGLTLDEFEAKKKTGTLRHVGLTESMHMIAARLNWTLEKTEDVLDPVIAESRIDSGYKPIEEGMACGVRQIGRGWRDGEEVLTLEFIAAVGQDNPRDQIEVAGDPSFTSTIPGGVNGDVATCAMLVNAIPVVLQANPGLHTMADLQPVACCEQGQFDLRVD